MLLARAGGLEESNVLFRSQPRSQERPAAPQRTTLGVNAPAFVLVSTAREHHGVLQYNIYVLVVRRTLEPLTSRQEV